MAGELSRPETNGVSWSLSLGLGGAEPVLEPEVGNKAGYTATPVACGWAGAVFEVT